MSEAPQGSLTVNTGRAVYDALPWRASDGGPASALFAVWSENGCLAGWVTGASGTYMAHENHDDGRPHRIAVTATIEDAVVKVAERDSAGDW